MKKIEISHKTIVFTVFFLLGLYLLFLIRDIMLGFFIAVMIMTALTPLVEALQKIKLPRLLAIWIVYILLIASIAGIIALIVPPLVSQTTSLIANLPIPDVTQFFREYHLNLQDIQTISSQLGSIPRILNVVTSTFSVILTIVTLLVMTFYMLIEREHLPKHLHWFFGDHHTEEKAKQFVDKVEDQIGHWVRGELSLMIIIGVMTFIGLSLLSIPYALPLAILAGLLEILPNIGPTISAIPAALVAYLTISPAMALAVVALYILVQQLENSLIVPQIMKSAVGVNPIITILLLLIGYRLGGVGGAALAIPIYLVIKVIATEFYKVKALEKAAEQ